MAIRAVGEIAKRLDVPAADVVERLLIAGVRQFEHEGHSIAAAEVWTYLDRACHAWDVTGELIIVPNRGRMPCRS